MSMAYLLPSASHSSSSPLTNPESEPPIIQDTPVVWRYLMGASSGLEIVVVDVPPGTGDI
ncbi:uncharacterized protein C8R40DRAFT_1169838 [Lentinula edodes]|uniref:uncharacterized protein n=1 Tax=Lentinula edodes TaxID=5353 RepID=UPI001E8E9F46|nr:uncharacterized protein C8R40DRAFT_1169838 [Lentinula edodes]KAH7876176.1 hypothetical protein C8R40DRAFT_1169838 [Lentinula edodes]